MRRALLLVVMAGLVAASVVDAATTTAKPGVTTWDLDLLARAEIKKRNMGLDPVFGEEMTETLKQAVASPPDVIEAARNALGGR